MEDAPTNLHVLHQNASQVHRNESFEIDVGHVVALQLHSNDLLNLANVICVQLAIEDSFLQLAKFPI